MPALRLALCEAGGAQGRRAIGAHEHDALGDVSTLADPAVVKDLVEGRMNR